MWRASLFLIGLALVNIVYASVTLSRFLSSREPVHWDECLGITGCPAIAGVCFTVAVAIL